MIEASLKNPLRLYAVVDMVTGEHIASIKAATFSGVTLGWIPDNLGVGNYLVFQPSTMLNGSCNIGKYWYEPIKVEVWLGSQGKWIAREYRSDLADQKLAPIGYKKGVI